MNDKQTALKAYLTTGPAASVLWEDPEAGLENNTKLLSEWLAMGNTRAISAAINDLGLGEDLGIQIPQTLIQSAQINQAVASGDEFPVEISNDTLAKLQFVLQHTTFDFTDTGMVDAVEILLTPYPSCLAKFEALKTRPGTIAEHFGGVGQDDINAIVAPG